MTSLCDKGLFIHDLYFVYVVEAFITLNWKDLYIYIYTWFHFLAYR